MNLATKIGHLDWLLERRDAVLAHNANLSQRARARILGERPRYIADQPPIAFVPTTHQTIPSHEPPPTPVVIAFPSTFKQSAVATILQAVAETAGSNVAELKSAKRMRVVAWPRFHAMLMIRMNGGYSLPQIGRMLGGRDHTTAMYGMRTAARLLRDDHDQRHFYLAACRKAEELLGRPIKRYELPATPATPSIPEIIQAVSDVSGFSVEQMMALGRGRKHYNAPPWKPARVTALVLTKAIYPNATTYLLAHHFRRVGASTISQMFHQADVPAIKASQLYIAAKARLA